MLSGAVGGGGGEGRENDCSLLCGNGMSLLAECLGTLSGNPPIPASMVFITEISEIPTVSLDTVTALLVLELEMTSPCHTALSPPHVLPQGLTSGRCRSGSLSG